MAATIPTLPDVRTAQGLIVKVSGLANTCRHELARMPDAVAPGLLADLADNLTTQALSARRQAEARRRPGRSVTYPRGEE